MDGEIVDEVFCPQGLENAAGAYAVFVSGDNMEPRFFAGETAWIHPGRQPGRGDFALVQIQPGDGQPPHAVVRRYLGWEHDSLIIEQLNPPQRMRLPRHAVLSVHVIVFAGRI